MEYTREAGPSKLTLPAEASCRAPRPQGRRPRRLLSVLNDFSAEDHSFQDDVEDPRSRMEVGLRSARDAITLQQSRLRTTDEHSTTKPIRRVSLDQLDSAPPDKGRRSKRSSQSEEPQRISLSMEEQGISSARTEHERQASVARSTFPRSSFDDEDRVAWSSDLPRRRSMRAVVKPMKGPLTLKQIEREAKQRRLAEEQAQERSAQVGTSKYNVIVHYEPREMTRRAPAIDVLLPQTRQSSHICSEDLADATRKQGQKRKSFADGQIDGQQALTAKRRLGDADEEESAEGKENVSFHTRGKAHSHERLQLPASLPKPGHAKANHRRSFSQPAAIWIPRPTAFDSHSSKEPPLSPCQSGDGIIDKDQNLSMGQLGQQGRRERSSSSPPGTLQAAVLAGPLLTSTQPREAFVHTYQALSGSGAVAVNIESTAHPSRVSEADKNDDESGRDVLLDLHAISQEHHQRSSWELAEPGVKTVANIHESRGLRHSLGPECFKQLCDSPAVALIEPPTTLTPPFAAIAAPSSWDLHRMHNSGSRQGNVSKDSAAQVQPQFGEVDVPFPKADPDRGVHTIATASSAALLGLDDHPVKDQVALPSTLSDLQPEVVEENSRPDRPSRAADHLEGQPSDWVYEAAHLDQVTPLEVRCQNSPTPGIGGTAAEFIPCHAESMKDYKGFQDDDLSLFATSPCQSQLQNERQPEPNPDHSETESADMNDNEALLEGLDGSDFADIELTPAQKSDTAPGFLQNSQSPSRNRSFRRIHSRQGRADSFGFLGEDNGFWDEVFGGEGALTDSLVLPISDEWPIVGSLSQSELTTDIEAPPMPCSPPPGAHLGFSTAGNKKLAPPSDAAVARVLKRLEQPASAADAVEKDIQAMSVALAARRAARGSAFSMPAMSASPRPVEQAVSPLNAHLDQQEEDEDDYHELTPVQPQHIPTTVSFKKANGHALELSTAALAAAKRRMVSWEAEHLEKNEPGSESQGVTSAAMDLPLLSDSVITMATAPHKPSASPYMPSIQPPSTQMASDMPRVFTPAALAARFASPPEQPLDKGNFAPAHVMTAGEVGRTDAILSQVTPPSQAPVITSVTRSNGSAQDRRSDIAGHLLTPIRPAASRTSVVASSIAPDTTPDRPTFTRLDGRTARISLGMTPRASLTPKAAGKPIFRTPFKTSATASRTSLSSSTTSPRCVALQGRIYPQDLSKSPHKNARLSVLAPTRTDPSVFSLTTIVPRLSYKQYGILPYSAQQNEAEQVPHEVATILNEPRRAPLWVFDGLTGGEYSVKTASEELQKAGASHASDAWVKNHWTMILWKLAYYTRCKPQEAMIWWCFEQVMRQMKYRYEREVNLAQRSAIKRIQERDSSPSLPMILRVFGHQRINSDEGSAQGDDGNTKGEGGGRGGGSYDYELELTDGWYRIRARMDQTLSRAFKRGKLCIGTKLAIQGARLESYSTDGKDVLTALDIAHLVLSGNGTFPAPWDSRMGFQKHPFSASLRSLTADGGLIPSMMVIITRLFPIAYVESNGSSAQQMGGARGAADEAEAQQSWEAKREDLRNRLEAKVEHDMRRIDEIREMLAASGSFGRARPEQAVEQDEEGESSTFSMDYDVLAQDTLEELLSSDKPSATLSSRLSSVSSSEQDAFLSRISSLASAQAEQIHSESRADVEQQLNQACPPRKVRSFRVCRFVDAQQATRPCKRTVQLTIWDLGESEALQEGIKYRVTNLVPTQRSSWRGCEVEADAFLATRRDSVWSRLPS